MDTIEQGTPCDVKSEQYEFDAEIIMDGLVPVAVELSCKDQNADVGYCSRNKCLIDLRAMLEFGALTDAFYFPDVETFGHVGFFEGRGTFEPTVENCKGIGSGGGSGATYAKECCGDYPFRNYYYQNMDTATMGCCEYDDIDAQTIWKDPTLQLGQGYRIDMKQCCASGVSDIGSS